MFMVKKEVVFFSVGNTTKKFQCTTVSFIEKRQKRDEFIASLLKLFSHDLLVSIKKQFELQADIFSDAWVIIKVINYNGGGGEMKSFTDLAHFSTHLKPINFIKKSENH